ncbi:MAG: methyltransferase, partial [Clostridia bacterium]|nr:methyltransferase [Clostridia bacterium]
NGTPDEVRRETRRVVELMSKNGGYITAPSQEIMPDVPYENLLALIDTAKEYAGD